MLPLSMANVGETIFIQRITGRDEVRQHLAEMGLIVGEPVKIVSSSGNNVILAVKGSRVALDKTLVNRIMV